MSTSYSRHSATDVEQACMGYLAAHEEWIKGYVANRQEEAAKARATRKAELDETVVGILWWKRKLSEREVGLALEEMDDLCSFDWSVYGRFWTEKVRSLLTQAKAAHGNSHMLLSTEDANLLHEHL